MEKETLHVLHNPSDEEEIYYAIEEITEATATQRNNWLRERHEHLRWTKF